MLTAEQKAHWDAFGFLVLRQLFAPHEVKELRQASMEVLNRHDGEDVGLFDALLTSSDFQAAFVDEPGPHGH